MELVNQLYLLDDCPAATSFARGALREAVETVVTLLAPFTPHLAEELWEGLGGRESIFSLSWPEFDPDLLIEEQWEIVVQISGKVRARITVPADSSEEEIRRTAMENERIREWVEKGTVRKVIYVPGRLINIVL